MNLGSSTATITQTSGSTSTVPQGTAAAVVGGDGGVVQVDNTDHIQYYESDNFGFLAIPDTSGNSAGGMYRTAGHIYYPNAAVLNAVPGTTLNGNTTFDPSLRLTTIYQLNSVNPQYILVGGGRSGKTSGGAYYTGGTLYYSTDEGNSFTSVGGLTSGNSYPTGVTAFGDYGVSALAFGATNNPNAAYVGLSSGDIYYSSDVTQAGGGFMETNFSSITPSNSHEPANIVMNPNNSAIAYAVVYGVGAYYTTNGNTWTAITGNLASLLTPTTTSPPPDYEQGSVTLFTPPGQTESHGTSCRRFGRRIPAAAESGDRRSLLLHLDRLRCQPAQGPGR